MASATVLQLALRVRRLWWLLKIQQYRKLLADRVSAKPLIALDRRQPVYFLKSSEIHEFIPFAVHSPPLAFVGNRSIIMGNDMGN